MARQPFFAELSRMPWWVGLIAAGLLTLIGAVFIPILTPDNPYVAQLRPAVQGFVYLFGLLCFLAALVSAVRSWRQGRLFAEMGLGRGLETLSWQEFEAMLAGAFREQGYLVMTGPPGPDDGVDLRLNKGGERVYVQAKHWRSNVGVRIVRELAAVVAAAGVGRGIVVSSLGFTREAREFATKADIELIGPDVLHRWFRQHSPSPTPHEADYLQPPQCPDCKVIMVRRIAQRGRGAGKEFWGCPNFPTCRETRPLEAGFPGVGARCTTPLMVRHEAKQRRQGGESLHGRK